MGQPTRVELSIDRAGHSGPLQVSIGAVDDDGHGSGYRLLGPKYIGDSVNVKTVVLTARDRDEIRRYLDLIPDES